MARRVWKLDRGFVPYDDRTDEKLRYPILHPIVPPPPADYAATPWARCKVQAVLPGLRFGDGVIPGPDVLSQMDTVGAGPGMMNGKVRTFEPSRETDGRLP
jgi:hypothetical protein